MFIYLNLVFRYTLISQTSLDAQAIILFQQSFFPALYKFDAHITEHPSRDLFQAIQIFDVKWFHQTPAAHDIQLYEQHLPELQLPSAALLQEWSLYVNIQDYIYEEGELAQWWEGQSETLPLLTEIALDYIWLPVSNADVERSFSVYANILRNDRQRLSESSLRAMTFMYFNNR